MHSQSVFDCLRQIAEALNARGINAPRGGQWHATSVRNVMACA
jgi:hypothetical protein